jgi:hypothetical protein
MIEVEDLSSNEEDDSDKEEQEYDDAMEEENIQNIPISTTEEGKVRRMKTSQMTIRQWTMQIFRTVTSNMREIEVVTTKTLSSVMTWMKQWRLRLLL